MKDVTFTAKTPDESSIVWKATPEVGVGTAKLKASTNGSSLEFNDGRFEIIQSSLSQEFNCAIILIKWHLTLFGIVALGREPLLLNATVGEKIS
jgi:hypothetical protein